MAATAKEVQRLKLELNQVTRTKSVLNQNQIQKLWNSTNPKYKYQRPAKGGGQWTYIKASYVRKVLDSVFGFNWDLIITTTDTEIQGWIQLGTKQIIVKGYIEGRVWFDGAWVSIKKYGTGRADIKFKKNTNDPLDVGNDIKSAESDLLKKCASKFGVGSDVYEQDEFMEVEIIGSDENSDKAKLAQKRLKKAKKVVAEEAKTVDEPKKEEPKDAGATPTAVPANK